jgi:hypothetical protein
MVTSMRRSAVIASLALLACGGAAAPEKAAQVPPNDPSDPDFAAYAAAHGIETLNGGGGDTPEVTADGLRLELLEKDKPVKLDGILNEWPAPAKASLVVKGTTKSAMKISLQYDDTKLYIGADVTDASFVAGQDHVSLLLAVPEPGGSYTTYGVALYAGKPGESEGSVRYGRHAAIAGAKIVEATASGGYTFEAVIPWSSLPEARTTRVGIHGVARYFDADDSIIATGPGDAQHPAAMPWVPSEPELSMVEQLLTPKGLTKTAPTAEVVADLLGNGMRERVAVFEHYLTICGTSYMGGTGFFFRDLGGEFVKLEVRDVTGRGKADVILRRRASVGEATREFVEVLSSMNANEEPRVTFAHEIAVRQSDKHIDNSVHMGRGEIEVAVEPAAGWDALSYKEPIVSDVEPILFPWGAVRSQVWRWDGARFSKGKEVAQKEQLPSGGTAEHPSPVHPPEPPTPKVSKGGELSARVLDQYRKDRGVGADLAAKVDLRVHVAGDGRPERVVLIGRDIVVFGPGFKGGLGYAYITLSQFTDASDVKDLSARDLTGGGAADIIVRGVRHMSGGSGESVDSEVLFVYEVRADAINRVFAIETGREEAGKRVQGLVQFIPAAGGKSFEVLAAPGRATGWTEKTYPWAQDQPGSGTVEPLLLPWGGISNLRYGWNGTAFAKRD